MEDNSRTSRKSNGCTGIVHLSDQNFLRLVTAWVETPAGRKLPGEGNPRIRKPMCKARRAHDEVTGHSALWPRNLGSKAGKLWRTV